MYPKLFNIFDSYTVMIIIGVILAFVLLNIYARKHISNKGYFYSLEIVFSLSIIIGFLGAIGVQKLFDLINNNFSRDFPMTFYGGLIFGVIAYFLMYFLYLKKRYPDESINQVFAIAPACITLAHGCGRIGCFLSGCCYGIETNSIWGMYFPSIDKTVYPTQLYEAIFLFVLTAVLVFLAFKYQLKYNLSIYILSYGVFRFFIEFIRGDDRGAYFLHLSPAQWISIVAVIFAIILIIIINKKAQKKPEVNQAQ